MDLPPVKGKPQRLDGQMMLMMMGRAALCSRGGRLGGRGAELWGGGRRLLLAHGRGGRRALVQGQRLPAAGQVGHRLRATAATLYTWLPSPEGEADSGHLGSGPLLHVRGDGGGVADGGVGGRPRQLPPALPRQPRQAQIPVPLPMSMSRAFDSPLWVTPGRGRCPGRRWRFAACSRSPGLSKTASPSRIPRGARSSL